MRINYTEFQQRIPDLKWDINELADKLSAIGFEAEVNDEALDITILSNRADCRNWEYLLYDFAAIYKLPVQTAIEVAPGTVIKVTLNRINHLLGTAINQEQYQQLERLGFVVNQEYVTAPSFRRDVETPADVAEEVIRLVGYNSVTPIPLKEVKEMPNATKPILDLAAALMRLGFSETRTTSFTKSGQVELKNPFSATEPYLRSTLLDGLLQTLAKNPYLKRAMFFEIGDTYRPEENKYLGIIVSGFKNLDEIAANLAKILSDNIVFKPVDEKKLKEYDVTQPRVYWIELPINKIKPVSSAALQTSKVVAIKPLSKFPPLIRDITVEISDEKVSELIRNLNKKFSNLLLVEVIDTYKKPEAKYSATTIRSIFQKFDSSFTQSEIDQLTKELEVFVNAL